MNPKLSVRPITSLGSLILCKTLPNRVLKARQCMGKHTNVILSYMEYFFIHHASTIRVSGIS